MSEFIGTIWSNIKSYYESLTIFHVLAAIFVIILILLYILQYKKSDNNDVLPSITLLNKKIDIAPPNVIQSTILGTSGSTVMGFFNLQQGNRTRSYNNEFIPLLFVDNNWWFEISHTSNETAARLRVQTNHKGTFASEIIELPSIPKQKWVFVAILREGRRFDVIYDDHIVASEHLTNYPVIISSSLSIGNEALMGKVIHVIIASSRLSPNEVDRQRRTYIDTNNKIIEDSPIYTSFPTLSLFAECPPGLPCNNITKPPINGLLEWETPYA